MKEFSAKLVADIVYKGGGLNEFFMNPMQIDWMIGAIANVVGSKEFKEYVRDIANSKDG